MADLTGGCTRAAFTWDAAADDLAGLPDGAGLNMAFEAVDRHAGGPRRAAVALRWLDAGGAIHDTTYGDLAGETSRFANALRALGVGAGDHVFSLLERVPELHVTALGALKARAVFCPLFIGYGPQPLHTRLARGRACVLVTTPDLYERKVAAMRNSLPDLRHVILVADAGRPADGTHRWRDFLNAADARFVVPATAPSDPALLHFTSGTTGAPKGALHAHRAVVAQHATARMALDLRPGDVYWCTADPGWVTATVYGIIAPLTVGATVLLDERPFDAARWCRLLGEARVNVWYTTPTALRMLQRLGEPSVPGRFDALRRLATVGEPLDAASVRWGVAAFGLPCHDTWWQTETGAIMIASDPSREVVPGSMGFPLPGIEAAVVRRRDPGGIEHLDESDARGELALRAGWPSMFTGYLDDEERYRACFQDGWYLTSDLVRRDREGRFWFVGRADDVIKSAGHLIGPFEVEAVLLEHPAVAEAAVVGRPDPVAHELVTAIVTLGHGVRASESLRLEIAAHARRRLGAAVAPKDVVFRADLPKTESGKILRRTLKAGLAGPPAEGLHGR